MTKHLSKVMPPPYCRKCGAKCAYYGPIGGYSVMCAKCNAKNAERQRRTREAAKKRYPS
jgi:hypothetical protein